AALAPSHAPANALHRAHSDAISLGQTVRLDDRDVFHDVQARFARRPRRHPSDRFLRSSSRRRRHVAFRATTTLIRAVRWVATVVVLLLLSVACQSQTANQPAARHPSLWQPA